MSMYINVATHILSVLWTCGKKHERRAVENVLNKTILSAKMMNLCHKESIHWCQFLFLILKCLLFMLHNTK